MQGDLTKENAKNAHAAVNEMFDAISKKKQLDFFGHLNDVLLFLESAMRTLPSENELSARAETK